MAKGLISEGVLEIIRSSWQADLYEFGKFVLREKRKKQKLTQKQMAQKVGLDQSRISRIEKGATPKDSATARAISECYQLSDMEEKNWFQLIGTAKEVDAVPFEQLLSIFTNHVDIIRQVKIRGDPTFAIEKANIVLNLLDGIIHNITSPKYRKPLQETYAHMLYEQGVAYHVTFAQHKMVSITQPIADEIQTIGYEWKNEEVVGLARICLGGSYYIQEKYDKALPLFEMAFNLAKNDIRKIEALRGLAITYARVEDKKGLAKVENSAKEIIDNSTLIKLNDICVIQEGIGRAQGVLRQPNAYETLEESRKTYFSMKGTKEKAPLREIQYSISMLEVAKLLEPKDFKFIEEIGVEGLKKAKEYDYERHANQIKTLLSKYLN